MTDQARMDGKADERPKLKSVTVQISYRSDTGFSSKAVFSKGQMEVPPNTVLLEAFEELSRMCTMFGLDGVAEQTFADTRERVKKDLEFLAQSVTQPKP